jgi:autotransporter-associated beta strand protein
MAGAGVLSLSGTNTYSGTTLISNGGTIQIGSDAALGSSILKFGQAGSPAGATIQAVGAARTLSNTVQISTGNAIISGSQNLILNGSVTNFGTASRTLTVTNPLTTLNGNVYLSSENAAPRTLTISGNGNTSSVVINGSIQNSDPAVVPSPQANGLTLNNATTTLTLSSGVANTYTGLTTVSAGELDLNKTAAVNAIAGSVAITGGTVKWLQSNQVADTATITVTSGAVDLNNQTETFNTLFVQGTGIGGAGALLNSGAGTGTLTGTGITLTGDASFGTTQGGAARLQLNNIVITDGAGSFALTKVGAGELVLGNSGTPASGNTFDGGVNNNAGTLIVNSTSNGGPGAITSGPLGTGTLTLNGGAIRAGSGFTPGSTLDNAITLAADTTIAFSSVTPQALLMGGPVTITGATRTLTSNATTDTTFAGAIGGAAGLGLTFNATSTGKFILAGSTANTYTGLTTVSAGELDLNKTANLGSGGGAIAGDGNTTTNDVTVSGGILKWLANEQIGNTATITVSGTGTVNLNGKTETLGSLIVNSGTFTTNGSGTGGSLTGTTATVDFEGGVSTITNGGSVTDGHIIIGSGIGAVGSGNSVEVQGGGTLTLQSGGTGMVMSGGTLTLDSSSGTAGKLVLQNPAAITSTGTSSIVSGGANANAGVIDMSTGTSAFNVSSGTLTVSAQVTNGALTKSGSGTMILTGANTYAGNTNVNSGTLLANNTTGSATGSGGVMVNSGGTLGGTGFIVATGNNINIGKSDPGGSGGTITGATNGTVGALTLTASNVIFGGNAGNLGTYAVDIAGATSDRLNITGVLDLSSAFDQITFNGTADGTTTYVLATYTSETGTFNTSLPTMPSGYSLVYGANELDLTPTAVPEPSTWLTGALAVSAILFTQRRRLRRLVRL